MKFSVFTASTPQWSPEETARVLAEQGWDGVEWRIIDEQPTQIPSFWQGNRASFPQTGLLESVSSIERVTREAGLEYSGVGGYARCTDHNAVEVLLRATAALGAGRVRVGVAPNSESYRATLDETRAHFSWVQERARHHGVKALIEIHHNTVAASASAAMRIVEGLDPAHIGVIHDVGNLVIEGWENPRWAFDLLGEYLAHVHVKNARWVAGATDTADRTSWTWEWATLREGQADIPAYLAALREHGYDGWVTVEDFAPRTDQRERLAENLAYLRDHAS